MKREREREIVVQGATLSVVASREEERGFLSRTGGLSCYNRLRKEDEEEGIVLGIQLIFIVERIFAVRGAIVVVARRERAGREDEETDSGWIAIPNYFENTATRGRSQYENNTSIVQRIIASKSGRKHVTSIRASVRHFTPSVAFPPLFVANRILQCVDKS